MALISCKECSKQVSSNAPQCPHCGATVNDKLVNIQQKAVTTIKQINNYVEDSETVISNLKYYGRAVLYTGGGLGLLITYEILTTSRGLTPSEGLIHAAIILLLFTGAALFMNMMLVSLSFIVAYLKTISEKIK